MGVCSELYLPGSFCVLCVCIWVHVDVCPYGGQRPTVGISLNSCSALQRQNVFLNPGWLPANPEAPQQLGLQCALLSSSPFSGCQGSNSGPHAYVVSTVLAGPSFCTPLLIFKLDFVQNNEYATSLKKISLRFDKKLSEQCYLLKKETKQLVGYDGEGAIHLGNFIKELLGNHDSHSDDVQTMKDVRNQGRVKGACH